MCDDRILRPERGVRKILSIIDTLYPLSTCATILAGIVKRLHRDRVSTACAFAFVVFDCVMRTIWTFVIFRPSHIHFAATIATNSIDAWMGCDCGHVKFEILCDLKLNTFLRPLKIDTWRFIPISDALSK